MEASTIEIAPGLRISPVIVTSAPALARLVQDNIPHFMKFLPAVTGLASVEEAEAYLARTAISSAEGETLEWHIFEHNILCGAVRVKDINQSDRTASIAYFVGERYQGKGIVTCAAKAVIRYCFGELGLNRIELKCATSNLPSQRLAERLGFAREGLLRQSEFLNGAFVDHYIYALLRQDFNPD